MRDNLLELPDHLIGIWIQYIFEVLKEFIVRNDLVLVLVINRHKKLDPFRVISNFVVVFLDLPDNFRAKTLAIFVRFREISPANEFVGVDNR